MNKSIAIIAGEPNSISSEIIFKSWKLRNQFIHKPFFVIGPRRPIDTLHNYGLKTFSPVFDESYDEEDDILIRIDRVVDELERFSKLSEDDLKNELQKTNEIIEYNFNFFKEWSYKRVDEIVDHFFGKRARELNII